jgi:hypothetical protein
MTSTRRKTSSGFSEPVEKLPAVVEDAITEKSTEVEEVKEEIKEETPIKEEAPVAAPVVAVKNNPKPVKTSRMPRRNTPKFSAKG